MRKSLQISTGVKCMCCGEQWGKPAPWQASSWQKERTWVTPGPPLSGLTGSLVMGALGGERTACLGGDTDAQHSCASSSPQWGKDWAGRQRWPLALDVVAPSLGSAGASGERQGQGTGPRSPECHSKVLCSRWGQSPHRPQARFHRAPPWVSGSTPAIRSDGLGDLSSV